MHPGLLELYQKLAELRTASGLTAAEVESHLVLGPGWIERIERGEPEPSVGMLAALTSLYGTDLASFFSTIDLSTGAVVLDRYLSATQDGADLLLHFPMGPHSATVRLERATEDELNDVLTTLRNALVAKPRAEAVAICYLRAVEIWPHLNPSDLWYFLVSHAYQDDFNHPSDEAGKDWAQSWKRASGWALERIFAEHYNPFLSGHSIAMVMPKPAQAEAYLAAMGINEGSAVEKSDIFLVGESPVNGEEVPFGVVHVKASFAERRTDDVPLSQKLMQRGYASPLVTMDCKSDVSANPVNSGELGPAQGAGVVASSKRLDIERDRHFDACFSYNRNTVVTPSGYQAAARIQNVDFSDPDDAFSRFVVRKWEDRWA